MWRNQQAYRQTANGKAKRRAQSARHRLRKNERRQQADVLPVLPAVLNLPSVSPATEIPGEGTGVAAAAPVETSGVETATWCCCEIRPEHAENRELFPPAESRVGHQYDPDAKKSCCLRPGCYVRFTATLRSPLQCFCSSDCRMALRRVRLREARWFRQQPPMIRELCPPAEAPD
ncbi:MAG: hypothetical protein ACK6EB_06025 [Planctomyces sp.]